VAPGARPTTETRLTSFDLVRTDRWRITRWIDREAALVDRVEALSAPEIDAALAAAGSLRTTRLAWELCRAATRVLNRKGGVPAALAMVAHARAIATETSDDAARSVVRGVESLILISSERPDRESAIDAAKEAVALAERSGDPEAIGRALLRLGNTTYNAQLAVTREPFERILAIADFIDDVAVVAHAAFYIAIAAGESGDPSGELRYGLTAIHYAEMSGQAAARINAHYAAAEAYSFLGYNALAIRYYTRCRELATAAGYSSAFGGVLMKIAYIHARAGRGDEARKVIAEALAEQGPDLRAHLLVLRSSLAVDNGELESAEHDLEEASKLMGPEKAQHVFVLTGMSSLRLAQKREQEALELSREAVRLAARWQHREQFTAATHAVRVLRRMKRYDEARAQAAAVTRLEENAPRAAIDETAWSTFFASRAGHDVEMVALALDAGDAGEAIRVANGMKARALRAFNERPGPLPSRLMSVEERSRARSIEERIASLNQKLVAGGGRTSELERELAAARLDLDELRTLAATRVSAALPEPSAVDDPRMLAPRHAVIQYVTAPDEVVIIGFAPGAGAARRVIIRRIPITRTALAKRIDALLRLLESRDLRYAAEARAMFDLLLEPVRALIRPGQTLCVIPDGDLWRVPFQALRTADGRYVTEMTTLFYAPSLAMADLEAGGRRAPLARDPTLLAFANPATHARSVAEYRSAFAGAKVGQLPDAEEEVREIARLYGPGSRVFIGENATETTLKREAEEANVIHIATHGTVDAVSPLASAILLAPGAPTEDGVLEAREILGLDLHSRLAVLSACSTGGGKAESGEGIIGLSWAFLAAGCPTTVVSHWQATSSVTSRLMIAFHRHLRHGNSEAVALQKAQDEIRRDRRYRHPYYWAPFAVVGAQ
jgi:CHAT domain-containing protein/tetratricopeptide (TPR) repeat protein